MKNAGFEEQINTFYKICEIDLQAAPGNDTMIPSDGVVKDYE
jgi:hypothetical protein